MEPKKNPKFDIHRKRGIIFNFSLAISLMLVITAFKWSVEQRDVPGCKLPKPFEHVEMASIPIVPEKQKERSAPEPSKLPDVKPSAESINFKVVSNSQPVELTTSPIDQSRTDMIEYQTASAEVPVEEVVEVWTFVEEMPEPIGGWEEFFKTLRKHMKYPRPAARNRIAGKVFIGFTINETGNLQDLSVIKGIGYGCDEEAMRVVAMTKWKCGKQRGRPVKVRMVQPVMFSLGTPQ